MFFAYRNASKIHLNWQIMEASGMNIIQLKNYLKEISLLLPFVLISFRISMFLDALFPFPWETSEQIFAVSVLQISQFFKREVSVLQNISSGFIEASDLFLIFCKHWIPWVSVEITHEKKWKLDQDVALAFLKKVLLKSSSFKRKLQRNTKPHPVLNFCFQNPLRWFSCFFQGLPTSISSLLFCIFWIILPALPRKISFCC